MIKYPKEELELLATKAARPSNEQKFGLLPRTPAAHVKTKKAGAAIAWDVSKGARREIAIQEFIEELKTQISEFHKEAKYIVPGSLNVYNDPYVHNCAKYGMYGWVEVY